MFSKVIGLLVVCFGVFAGDGQHRAMPLSKSLVTYTGPVVKPRENTTIYNTVMCGYQGWFMAKGDGYKPGFIHWGGMDRTPPRCSVDFWPDMSELDEDEKFPTNYRYPDGSKATVFSSTVKKTVLRHFKWMKDYGIDGVWIQRFTSCVKDPGSWNYQRSCAVLNNCREGANRYGRTYAVMYDTDFDRKAVNAMKSDWTRLIKEMKLTTTPAYVRHRGAPVISLWGYGFEHRKFDAAATEEFFKFLKRPENGGCTIMLGVPNDWVTWKDDRMRLLKKFAHVISPWNVGRYGSIDGAKKHFAKHWPADLAFCKANDKDYYAVAFPGFSWTNLQKGQSKLNKIPRLGGKFLWSQFEEVKRYGMNMVYVAMFDEVDEGTAIFKCTNKPPVGRFATYEGYPSDHYLKLCGLAGRLLRGDKVKFPNTKPDPAQLTYKPMSVLEYYRNPNRFPKSMTKRWKKAFDGIKLLIHQEPYSNWVQDFVDGKAFDIELTDWKSILSTKQKPGLMIFAGGGESFNTSAGEAAKVAEMYRTHLRRGGTLLVASSGRYPMFHPGGGREAKKFGFRLKMVDSPAGSRVVFDPQFANLPTWKLNKMGGSRLMHSDLYRGATSYKSLASVMLPDGSLNGDAVACVQPGGELGQGRIIYVAGMMLGYPNRTKVFDAILRYVGSIITK